MQHLPTTAVAERLHVTSQTIRNWIERGELQAKRIGRNYKIPVSEVERILGEPIPIKAG